MNVVIRTNLDVLSNEAMNYTEKNIDFIHNN